MKKRWNEPFHEHLDACELCCSGLPSTLCAKGQRLFRNAQDDARAYFSLNLPAQVQQAKRGGAQ